mgnify:CR=1 FL=1
MEEKQKTEASVFAYRKHGFLGFGKRIGGGKRPPLKRVLAVVVGLVVIAGGVVYFTREKPVLVIGGQKIYKKQYDLLVSQARKRQINSEGAKAQIVNAYKVLDTAKKLDITIDDSATDLSQSVSNKAYDRDDFGQLMSKVYYVESYVKSRNRDGYEGYVFFYPYSRHFLSSEPTPTDPDFNNPTAIEADRKSAKSKAESARSDLMSGKTDASSIVKRIKADSSLEYGSSSNKSGQFRVDTSAYPLDSSVIGASNTVGKFFKLLQPMKEGEVSPLQDDIQSYYDLQSSSPQTKYTAYYFVVKNKNLKADKDFESKYNDALKGVKVVDHAK